MMQTGRVLADADDPQARFADTPDPFGVRLLSAATASDGPPIFDWQADRLLAGKAVVVGHQRLGAISISLPTASLQAKVAAARDQGLAVAVVMALLGALFGGLLARSLLRPVRELLVATHRVAERDLSQDIVVSTATNWPPWPPRSTG